MTISGVGCVYGANMIHRSRKVDELTLRNECGSKWKRDGEGLWMTATRDRIIAIRVSLIHPLYTIKSATSSYYEYKTRPAASIRQNERNSILVNRQWTSFAFARNRHFTRREKSAAPLRQRKNWISLIIHYKVVNLVCFKRRNAHIAGPGL